MEIRFTNLEEVEEWFTLEIILCVYFEGGLV